MKFKPTQAAGGLLVELSPQETSLPSQEMVCPPAFGLKKILVPVDFSECSEKALAYAVHFARQFDAEIVLMHVVKPYPPIPQMDVLDLNYVSQAQEDLERLQRKIEGSVRSASVLRTGDPRVEIIEIAESLGIDLIILATHGRTGLAHVFLGSTVERVVRHARCPCLIVREKEHEFIRSTNADASFSSNAG